MTFQEALAAECPADLRLTDSQLEKLGRHNDLLSRWNKVLNLTRICGSEEAIRFHFLESLLLGRALPPGNFRIADVGSGGGFPGIPVAILRPECLVCLVEAHQRKAVFLREVAREIPNVVVDARRAEEVRETYDWIVSRAVKPASVLPLRLASNMALLMAKEDLRELPKPSRVVSVPKSRNRVVAMFHVKPKHVKIDQRG